MEKVLDLSNWSSTLKHSNPEYNGKWILEIIKTTPNHTKIIIPSGDFSIKEPIDLYSDAKPNP